MKKLQTSVLCAAVICGALGFTYQAEASTRKTFEVPSAAGTGTMLQVYRLGPEVRTESVPAILLFHGGSWRKGSPRQLLAFAADFADAGYMVYSAEYRLVGKNADTVEDCIADVEAVYQWIVTNAEAEGIDSNRFFIGGASAGGHVALCAFLKTNESGDSRFSGYIGYNPVVTVESGRFQTLFDPYGSKYDPLAQLNPSAKPMLVFHGNEDVIVPLETIRDFEKKANTLKVTCYVEVFEGEGHGFFNAGKSVPEIRNRLRETALNFLTKYSQ